MMVEVQEVTGEVQVVAEILIFVAPVVLVPVVILGSMQVEVDSSQHFVASPATEEVLAEVWVTEIGTAQAVTDDRCLALVKAPSSICRFLFQ